jgi:phage gp46-like protein
MDYFSSAFSSAFTQTPAPPPAPAGPGRVPGDIRTFFIDSNHGIGWTMDGNDLATDPGLTTAVVISLFTDAPARDDDPLPPGQTDRRGWWGDAWPVTAGDSLGSRLWLLRASKQLPQVLNQARRYAEEALAWLLEDGVARRVEVAAWIVRFEVMGLSVKIHRPDGAVVPFHCELLWQAMES